MRCRSLGPYLKNLPRECGFRYNQHADHSFREALFESLADGKIENIKLLFPDGIPTAAEQWRLSVAQGAVDGAEYTEAARGKRCGHIFKHEEATYFCRTCTTDATCVLCSKCFEASNHEGHHVEVHLSEGSSGCCDCGDEEAWNRPLKCGVHTRVEELHGDATTTAAIRTVTQSPLPPELQESIRNTIGSLFDYMCDVFSCSPEHMRAPKHEQLISRDEELARLVADRYGITEDRDACNEYALVLWNDEKHTVLEVREQVARACRRSKTFGYEKAQEIDQVGRAVIQYSESLPELIKKARILEQIKVTVTIRSSRDVFREQMCDSIVDWLADISSCSVGGDHKILMDTVCSEMLKQWRLGSNASNMTIGKQGYTDHQRSDDRLRRMEEQDIRNRMLAAQQQTRQARLDIQLMVNNPDQLTVGPLIQQDETDDDNDNGDEVSLEGDAMNLDDFLQDPPEGEVDGGGITLDDVRNAAFVNAGGLIANIPPPAPSSSSNHSDVDVPMLSSQNDPEELLPRSVLSAHSAGTASAPGYWLAPGKRIAKSSEKQFTSIEEDFEKRVRIDFLILYDLRMWKTLRNNLRRLYIGTVIKVPHFKRVLGLRFAAIYKVLAQLYLVADREPDHSIINLSLQMLTTPSITAEIINRGNFCTRLLAILYTFLTKRRVGSPEDVDLTTGISSEPGVMTNRRIHHFFHDMKYLLEAKYAQERIRADEEYLLQFLDLVKLFQGIDSNKRAVGEHVPYESDTWVTLMLLERDLARNIRIFARSFTWRKGQDPASMCRALRQIAKTATINSLGTESQRFQQPDKQLELRFKVAEPSEYEKSTEGYQATTHPVVDFVVEKEMMSFHHPLHWLLSWVIDEGKSMSREQLLSQLTFDQQKLQMKDPKSSYSPDIPSLAPLQYLLALFDMPLRTCAWLAQLEAEMWVRNGQSLRQQTMTFRNVVQREITSQRNIFLLQIALVVCPPETFLAAIIDRFGMNNWTKGDPTISNGWEADQQLSVAESFVQLLIVLLSDRTLLRPIEEDSEPVQAIAQREICQALCFKPLTYSELTDHITHTTTSIPNFNQTLSRITHYKAPEGLQDAGSFQLRDEYYSEVDPYNYFYNKNQRDQSETAWRRHQAKKVGVPEDDVVYEPQLRSIKSGLFTSLANFTQKPLFCQVIWGMLHLAMNPTSVGQLRVTKIETFLPMVLHLVLIAISEDSSYGTGAGQSNSFVDSLLAVAISSGENETKRSILQQLFYLLEMDGVHEPSKPKLRLILQRVREKRRTAFDSVVQASNLKFDASADNASKEAAARERAEKKRITQERHARVMASFKDQQSQFLSNQMHDFDMSDWDDLGSDVEMQDDSVTKTWHFPKDICLQCQEETNDQQVYGSLAYICRSRVFRETNLEDENHIREVGMSPTTYDRGAEQLRPFGIARQNVEKVMRVSESGEATTYERRGLGKGWPSSKTTTGSVITGCGHLMHYACFEDFLKNQDSRTAFQIARCHPERTNEFVCPLCKALGNTFLPIVFPPKKLISPSQLSGNGFDDWMQSEAPLITDKDDIGDIEASIKDVSNHRTNWFLHDGGDFLRPDPPTMRRFFLPTPSFLRDTLPSLSNSFYPLGGVLGGVRRTLGVSVPKAIDPRDGYKRVIETIQKSRFDPQGPASPLTEYWPSDFLARALASSISAMEIHLRGQESPQASPLLLDKVSPQATAHLRVVSETCSIFAGHNPVEGKYGVGALNLAQVLQLFGSEIPIDSDLDFDHVDALLHEDIFEFFARCSVFLIPFLKILKPQHVMRICMLAETVKVVLVHLQSFAQVNQYANQDVHLRTDEQGASIEGVKTDCSDEQSQAFSAFVQHIIDTISEPLERADVDVDFVQNVEVNPNARSHFDNFVRGSVLSYLLPFLRKCLLLMHIRAGVDFSAISDLNSESPEIDRLAQALGLPSLDSLIQSVLSNGSSSEELTQLIQSWITHWRVQRRKLPKKFISSSLQNTILKGVSDANLGEDANLPPGNDPTAEDIVLGLSMEAALENILNRDSHLRKPLQLRVPHPGIYELVPLPQTHDILNAESLSRSCPTTKGPLTDPCLCLLCGDIFCGQAQCCSKERVKGSGNTVGGCVQHQDGCGDNIGLFFNIRKNAILFLNKDNGCFQQAPYLDEHGETDMGLKRKSRLFLDRNRYDRLLRDAWLSHGIPNVIARRLESEVNTGGWLTL